MLEFLVGCLARTREQEGGQRSTPLVLVHDRASLSPQLLESLKEDLIEMISKYMEIDDRRARSQSGSRGGYMALVGQHPDSPGPTGVQRAKANSYDLGH